MQTEKAREIIAVIMVTYPNYKPISVELAAKIWADATEEYSYEQVSTALNAYIRANTSGFAPVPGQIIDIIHTMIAPQQLNEMEAWSLVSKAIRNSGYNSVEEFAKLPPLVQKAVGLPSQLRIWSSDENYNENVAMSNFQRAYKVELQREQELRKIPKDFRELIEKANEGSYSARIEQERAQTIESANERKQSGIKALEMKSESVSMPEKYRKRLED